MSKLLNVLEPFDLSKLGIQNINFITYNPIIKGNLAIGTRFLVFYCKIYLDFNVERINLHFATTKKQPISNHRYH